MIEYQNKIAYYLAMLQNDIRYVRSFGWFRRIFWDRYSYLKSLEYLNKTIEELELCIQCAEPTAFTVQAAYFVGVFREKYWPHS